MLVSLGCIFWCLRLASVVAFTTWAFVVSVRFGWFVSLLFMVIQCCPVRIFGWRCVGGLGFVAGFVFGVSCWDLISVWPVAV